MTPRAEMSAGVGGKGNRTPGDEDRRRFCLWLDDADREALEILAERNERPVAAEVRDAVRQRIAREARALRSDGAPWTGARVENPDRRSGRDGDQD